MVHLRIGKGEALKHLRLDGLDDGGVHRGEAARLLRELGVKVAHRLLATLRGGKKHIDLIN